MFTIIVGVGDIRSWEIVMFSDDLIFLFALFQLKGRIASLLIDYRAVSQVLPPIIPYDLLFTQLFPLSSERFATGFITYICFRPSEGGKSTVTINDGIR